MQPKAVPSSIKKQAHAHYVINGTKAAWAVRIMEKTVCYAGTYITTLTGVGTVDASHASHTTENVLSALKKINAQNVLMDGAKEYSKRA